MPGRLQSLRSAPPGCRGLREVTFERWTLTRSSYRNRIPRERSPPGRTCGLPGRPRLHARPQRGQSGADKRAPRRLGGGGERESARARPQAGTPRRDRCGRAEGGGYGPPRPGCTDRRPRRYPGTPAGPATLGRAETAAAARASRSLSLAGRNSPRSPPLPPQAPQHFLPEILPGLRQAGSRQSLRPQGRGAEGAGWTVRVGSAAAEAHGTCSRQQWPAVRRPGQNGGNCRPSAARCLAPNSAGLGMRRPRPRRCT